MLFYTTQEHYGRDFLEKGWGGGEKEKKKEEKSHRKVEAQWERQGKKREIKCAKSQRVRPG